VSKNKRNTKVCPYCGAEHSREEVVVMFRRNDEASHKPLPEMPVDSLFVLVIT
jgi:hypothetical protein